MDYQGGGGGFGGGTPVGGTPPTSSGGRSGGGGGARKSNDEQTVQPVTVSMCLGAQLAADGNGEQLADGRKLYHIKLVGAVRSVDDFSTNCLYGIEDGTGLIEVKQWIDANDCAALYQLRQACNKENVYLAITGQIKDYDGKKMIVAEKIRPLSTGNEITHHMLEVVYAAENSKRLHTSSMSGLPVMTNRGGVGFGGGASVQQHQYGGGDLSNCTLRDAVVTFLRAEGDSSETGANVPACVRRLQGNFSEHEIRKVIDDLAAEGHIYSTVDENNYKFAM